MTVPRPRRPIGRRAGAGLLASVPAVPYDAQVSRETALKVLEIESRAILDLRDRIDESFDRMVDVLFHCRGRVVVTGMGKSGLIGRKISATLSSTGTPSHFLHPADPAGLSPERIH